MANLLDSLRIGGNAVSAQQIAAQVVGTNISNASNPGYHRQDYVFITQAGLGGVRDVQLTRSSSAFLDAQVNAQQSQLDYNTEHAQGLELIMEAVGTLDDAGINASLSDFFSSWRNVNVAPTDTTTRLDLLAKTDILTSRLNQSSANLTKAQQLADEDIVTSIGTLNEVLASVASLNGAVTSAEAGGEPSSALRDQRDAQVRQLASLIGATTTVDAAGQVVVQLGGFSLVSGSTFYELQPTIDVSNGMHAISIAQTSWAGVDSLITGGSIGAKIAVRDQDIPNTLNKMDTFAFEFGTAVNTLHSTGYGLDGQTGRNLFNLPTDSSSASAIIGLDATMVDQPTYLAAAQSPSSVFGDSSNALAIIDLENSEICLDGTVTPSDSLAQILAASGQAVQLAQVNRDQASSHLLQVQGLYEEQLGVSINEQLLQLSRIQNAFQASAKLIHVIENMLETLQSL